MLLHELSIVKNKMFICIEYMYLNYNICCCFFSVGRVTLVSIVAWM